MNHSDGLRLLAERYIRLADNASTPAERAKYLDYAQAYYDLSEQVERREREYAERASAQQTHEARPRVKSSA